MGHFFRKTLIFAFCAVFAPLFGGQDLSATDTGVIYEARLAARAQDDYDRAVEALFQKWETTAGKTLAPGDKRRAVLKIATHMGPGLSTPKPLIRAAARALEKRGFSASEIAVADMTRRHLFEAGFLRNARDAAQQWEGHPVLALGEDFASNPLWFYDSPLPTLDRVAQAAQRLMRGDEAELAERDRKSYLSPTLFLESDFWISLPVACDSAGIGVDGALANASVRTVTNNERFLDSTGTGPVAVAEIAAIPEMRRALAFTLLSLENFQYIGGPVFNSYYTGKEPFLWLGNDPVAMDYQLFLRFNERRKWAQLPLLDQPVFLGYAKTLGLGEYDPKRLRLERVSVP